VKTIHNTDKQSIITLIRLYCHKS